MHQVNAVLVQPHQRSEVAFTLARSRIGNYTVLVSQPQQALFFQEVLFNIKYPQLTFTTFQQYLAQQQNDSTGVIILDIPENFQTAQKIFVKAQKQLIYLVLMKFNKKYLQILPKKLPVVIQTLSFSPNMFVGINDSLRQLVDSSYDLNRAAFYAYGAYINTYRQNLLKRIFRTEIIDVAQLAKGFGFNTPPRVKDGHFLTREAQKQQVQTKKTNKQAAIKEKQTKLQKEKKEKKQKKEKMEKKEMEVKVQKRRPKKMQGPVDISSKKKIIQKKKAKSH